ncbi:MAG: 7-carboxy-7-deazaguanine synthase QueE [Bacteroidales bacterium]|nr:7-carboxy-7-deazaguanine synthase QueE [Bacteroidales bacterium]
MNKAKNHDGLKLPVVEEFYSIQGEGFHTGKAAYFLRIGGCDVSCAWCDEKRAWNAGNFQMIDIEGVVERIAVVPAKAVVVTGGEPLLWNLDILCKKLKEKGIETFLETSGSEPLSGQWDWVCLSPKKNAPPLHEVLEHADELKVVIETITDFAWAEENAKEVPSHCKLWLQPEWSCSQKMMQPIVDYILQHPKWSISLQSHKYMRVP